jgi:hypothetical protein
MIEAIGITGMIEAIGITGMTGATGCRRSGRSAASAIAGVTKRSVSGVIAGTSGATDTRIAGTIATDSWDFGGAGCSVGGAATGCLRL